MILLDVNVVVATHRADSALHGEARPWLDNLIASGGPFSVPSVVWGSFVRITTNHRIFSVPTPLDDAFHFARAIIAQPNHRTVEPGDRHFAIFERLCHDGGAVGDLSPDAYLAAIAIEHGATWASFDRDFARFEGLQWVVPRVAS